MLIFLLGDNILHTWVLLCFTLRLVSSSQMDSQLLTKQDKLEYTLQTMHDHPRILTKIGLSPSVIFPSKLSTKSIKQNNTSSNSPLTCFKKLNSTQFINIRTAQPYCWWLRNPANQLRLVCVCHVVVWDFWTINSIKFSWYNFYAPFPHKSTTCLQQTQEFGCIGRSCFPRRCAASA